MKGAGRGWCWAAEQEPVTARPWCPWSPGQGGPSETAPAGRPGSAPNSKTPAEAGALQFAQAQLLPAQHGESRERVGPCHGEVQGRAVLGKAQPAARRSIHKLVFAPLHAAFGPSLPCGRAASPPGHKVAASSSEGISVQ